MKTRKFRRSFGFVVASELTVAAHLLFLLPPKVQAAVPIPAASEEESGERALALLQFERAEPVSQEPVDVNKDGSESRPSASLSDILPDSHG